MYIYVYIYGMHQTFDNQTQRNTDIPQASWKENNPLNVFCCVACVIYSSLYVYEHDLHINMV